MHKLQARLHPRFAFSAALACALLSAACVEQFEGSNIQIDFGPAMPAQTRQGVNPLPGGAQLPFVSHYRLYGITADADGMLTDYTELQRFEIHRIVEKASPCFIEPEVARFPGLHSSQYEAKIKEETGIIDIANPPAGASEEDKIDVATAMQRTMNIDALTRNPGEVNTPALLGAGGLKAVTSVSIASSYPGVNNTCFDVNPDGDRNLIPAPSCIDDLSNEVRLEVCKRVWAENPGLYEGTDRVLTEPLAGEFFGIVTGMNPINRAVLGGTQFFVEDVIGIYDAYAVATQYDDLTGDGVPDVPPGAPSFGPNGLNLCIGVPSYPTRGVTRVQMAGQSMSPAVAAQLSCQLAIFSDLGQDNVHF